MKATQRKRRNLMQNIAIALLSVSAVLLFAQTQLYNLGVNAGGSYLNRLTGSPDLSAGAPSQALTGLSAPVRLAVTGSFGRYGDLQLTTSAEKFVAPATLLSEALGSAGAIAPCREQDFSNALSETSVYYDFLVSLPLSVLAELTGTRYSGDGFARRLLLAEAGNGVTLYLWSEETGWARCSTAVTREQLNNLVADYELGNAAFALDNAEVSDAFKALNPYSLFLSKPPELDNLLAVNPLADTGALLSALGFNPHTNARYLEPDGTDVIMEGDSSLRIRTDGTVLYKSGSTATISITAEDGLPTATGAVIGASALFGGLLGNLTGDAALYLQSIQQSGERSVLRFGYQVDGTPIRFASGDTAAELTLNRTEVVSFSLRFRQYTTAEAGAPLLPLAQAAAIAAPRQDAELSIGYVDNGEDTVTATWLTD